MDPSFIKFNMPPIPLGSPVIWYRTGVVDRKHAQLGFVIQAGARTVTVRLASGQRVDAVRHHSDPKLELSPDQREQGSWDYTPHYVATEKRIADLEAKVSAMEKQTTALVTKGVKPVDKPKKPLSPGLVEMMQMRREAKELGISVPTNIKKENLQKLIDDAKVEKVVS